jgi:hypothetical protein
MRLIAEKLTRVNRPGRLRWSDKSPIAKLISPIKTTKPIYLNSEALVLKVYFRFAKKEKFTATINAKRLLKD